MVYKPVKCELKCILRDVNKETNYAVIIANDNLFEGI